MAITERRIMRIKPGKWDEIITLEQKWNKLEAIYMANAFPPRTVGLALNDNVAISFNTHLSKLVSVIQNLINRQT